MSRVGAYVKGVNGRWMSVVDEPYRYSSQSMVLARASHLTGGGQCHIDKVYRVSCHQANLAADVVFGLLVEVAGLPITLPEVSLHRRKAARPLAMILKGTTSNLVVA